MNGVQEAKRALIGYASAHDTQRAVRRAKQRPWLIVGAAAVAGLLVTRMAARTAARGVGGRVMSVFVLVRLARLAMRYGPILASGYRHAQRAAAQMKHPPVVRVRPAAPVPLDVRPRVLEPVSSSVVR